MINLVLTAFLFGTAWGAPLQAGVGELGRLQDLLFPPDLIMRNQKALNVTQEQRQYILEQTQEATVEFTSLRWDLQDGLQELREMVKRNEKEQVLLEQLDRVLDLERQVKRAQLLLAVRIRSTLTEEQVEMLQEMKPRRGAAQRRARQPNQQRP
jgi:hypothetical protein